MEKKEHSYTIGGNVNWYSNSGEQYGGSLKITFPELLIQSSDCYVLIMASLTFIHGYPGTCQN